MLRSSVLAVLLAITQTSTAEFGLAGQLFQLSGGSSVNNAKLRWSLVSDATSYSISRSDGSQASSEIAKVVGDSYDDYDLTIGSSYVYQITALGSNSNTIETSSTTSLSPFNPTGSYSTYENTESSNLSVQSNLYANGTYYQYTYNSYSNGSMSSITQQTSSDGYTFTGNNVVLTGQTVCASINYSCLLQRLTFEQHPGTGNIVMWAHLENTANYDLAQVAVASAVPGKNFTFDGTYRPLGYDSRDITFFTDGDDGYLISATDTNTNMNIYNLTSNWTAVASLADEVYINDYREAPSMVQYDGYYYLYTSRAAGWYPSQPEYIASQAIGGPWSSPVVVGNTATFSTQSGSMVTFNNGQLAMEANRWSANWVPAAGPNRDLVFPASFSSQGNYSTYDYYKTVQYNDKPSSSNAGTTNITFANDATEDNPNEYWVPTRFPFYYQIDLGANHTISQVSLTTNMIQGSETYYQFNVTGSTNGESFSLLANEMNNTDVGFVATYPTSTESYRYVRLNVESIINTHNGNSATFAAGLVEVTVYGQ